MNSNAKKYTKTKIVIIALIILAVITGVAIVVYRLKTNNSPNNTSATKTLPDGTTIQNRESNSNNNTQTPTNQNNQSVEVTITQVSQSTSALMVKALVSGVNSGQCTLTLKKDSTVITKTANIATGPSYYYCDGFSVNKNELQKGQWQINVGVSAQGKNGNTTQEVTIQ